jgi:hypothetical protein
MSTARPNTGTSETSEEGGVLLNVLLNPLLNCIQQRGVLAPAPPRASSQSAVSDSAPPTRTPWVVGSESETDSWDASRGSGSQDTNSNQVPEQNRYINRQLQLRMTRRRAAGVRGAGVALGRPAGAPSRPRARRLSRAVCGSVGRVRAARGGAGR